MTKIPKGPSFIKYEVPKPPERGDCIKPPAGGMTTKALGEEGSIKPPPGGGMTTKALGEEG
ncbi:hypothetical protein HPC49_55110, partial [Pyxidicoccus fallax]